MNVSINQGMDSGVETTGQDINFRMDVVEENVDEVREELMINDEFSDDNERETCSNSFEEVPTASYNEALEDKDLDCTDDDTNPTARQINERLEDKDFETQKTDIGHQRDYIDEIIGKIPKEHLSRTNLKAKATNKKPVIHQSGLQEFIEWLIGVKKHRIILINEDIISEESSEKRIVVAEFVLALALSIVVGSLILVFLVGIPFLKDKIIRYPLVEETRSGYSWDSKVVLIDSNSTVWHMSMNDFKLEKLLKLPNSKLYHGYGDNNGTLFFINGRLRKSVVKYFPDTGQHMTVKIKQIDEFIEAQSMMYFQMLQINQLFWLFGRGYEDLIAMYQPLNFSPDTHLWSQKKSVIFKGPQIPEKIIASSSQEAVGQLEYCYSTLNRSHILFFAMSRKDNLMMTYDYLLRKRVYLVDFHNQKWTEWPYLQFDDHFTQLWIGCASVITFKKSGSRYDI